MKCNKLFLFKSCQAIMWQRLTFYIKETSKSILYNSLEKNEQLY